MIGYSGFDDAQTLIENYRIRLRLAKTVAGVLFWLGLGLGMAVGWWLAK